MPGPNIESLSKLLGSARDGALLRYTLGLAHAELGNTEQALSFLHEAITRDPAYSAAWKALGRCLQSAGRTADAHSAFERGIEAARLRGDKQSEKEMTVFAKRLGASSRPSENQAGKG